MTKEFIMNRLRENYDKVVEMGYEVVGVFLQGSQNYNLQYEGSDIDCKAIVLPRFKDFVMVKKEVSTTHVLENNEHIDLKDIRAMFHTIKKQNINFVEILFTEYYVLNPKYEDLFMPLIENNELIARYNNYASISCMVGMIMEKYNALEHPYPATKDKIDKFGYDGKQLSHLLRVKEFMERYILDTPYKECLISKTPKYLIDVKKNERYSLEQARALAKIVSDQALKVKREYIATNPLIINEEASDLLDSVAYEILKRNFITELQVG